MTKTGCRYSVSDYVLVGWQDDDLPIFGKIRFIAVCSGQALIAVSTYGTLGIERHYHSFVLGRSTETCTLYWLSELVACQSFKAHQLSNGYSYITFRSHIERYE